jgi:hypothetical protein
MDRRQTVIGRESDRIEAKNKRKAKLMKLVILFFACSINQYHSNERNE